MSYRIRIPWRSLIILSVLAGVVYNSWPLGLLLNPVVARQGLASELGGAGQPYNWVFIWGDVLSGLIMLVVCWQFWLRAQDQKIEQRRMILVTLGAMAVFGIGAGAAALCRVPCVSVLRQCPVFTHNPIALAHSLASVAGPIGLFFSLASLWWQRRASRLLAVQTVAYVIFGSWTLATLMDPSKGVVPQNVFITCCAVCLAGFPWSFKRAYELSLNRKNPSP